MGRRSAARIILETRLTDFLETWLRDLEVKCARQSVVPGRDNLLAWYDAPSSNRRFSSTFIKTPFPPTA